MRNFKYDGYDAIENADAALAKAESIIREMIDEPDDDEPDIPPALSEVDWAQIPDAESALVMLNDDRDVPAVIALANAALHDEDPRKIRREHVELLRKAAALIARHMPSAAYGAGGSGAGIGANGEAGGSAHFAGDPHPRLGGGGAGIGDVVTPYGGGSGASIPSPEPYQQAFDGLHELADALESYLPPAEAKAASATDGA